MSRSVTVVSLLGTNLDSGLRRRKGRTRWEVWRPTVSLFMHDDLEPDRLVLLADPRYGKLSDEVTEDVRSVSPTTEIERVPLALDDPWDFAEVYGALRDFTEAHRFDPESEDVLVHMTTGTHVAQICLFLLVESGHLPGRLIQSSPPKDTRKGTGGTYAVIDLDLSRYDRLAARFAEEQQEGIDFLKSGIATRNEGFNRLMERIERVALASEEPILLGGPTGAGKTQLARRIFELTSRHGARAPRSFVEVNCATLRGDQAMSALFGHEKGAFTGALTSRDGLLREADGGVLFLDEIGELGLDEQAMLLRAIEDKRFLPVGGDRAVESSFRLIAGTNRDLGAGVREGRFREDLLARIDLWTFQLPALSERREDIEPNLDFELGRFAENAGRRVTFNREAREAFLGFALDPRSSWRGNFRDLRAAVKRMATLAEGKRIDRARVAEETGLLRERWSQLASQSSAEGADLALVEEVLGADAAAEVDLFDAVQLAEVIRVCRASSTVSEAGRTLFAASRAKKASTNDSARLRKYLARFGLEFADARRGAGD
ncbi:MAG: RNA repair transcriptional activator RtcR [Planctomycetota bacterium]